MHTFFLGINTGGSPLVMMAKISSHHHSSIDQLIKLFIVSFVFSKSTFQRWSLLIEVSTLPNNNINKKSNSKMNTNIIKDMNNQSNQAQESGDNSSVNRDQEKNVRPVSNSGEAMKMPSVGKPEISSEECDDGKKRKEKSVEREQEKPAKKKRMLRRDEIDVTQLKMKRARVESKAVVEKRVETSVQRKLAPARSSNLPFLRSKPAPRTKGSSATSSKMGRDGPRKRGSTHPEERDQKRVKRGEKASEAVDKSTGEKKIGEKNDWLSFLGDGDRLVAEMIFLERKRDTSSSSCVQIKTAKEAREVKERYESLYRVCRTGLGWMDDLAVQMRVLEWKRIGAMSEKERKRVAERASWKKEMVKEKHKKVSRVVEKMRERVKEVRDALTVWEKKQKG